MIESWLITFFKSFKQISKEILWYLYSTCWVYLFVSHEPWKLTALMFLKIVIGTIIRGNQKYFTVNDHITVIHKHIYPSINPSSSTWRWSVRKGNRFRRETQTSLCPATFFQALQGNPKGFRGQKEYIISPPSYGYALGLLPVELSCKTCKGTCPVGILIKPPSLTAFDVEEQRS